jgi:hypothetical protein
VVVREILIDYIISIFLSFLNCFIFRPTSTRCIEKNKLFLVFYKLPFKFFHVCLLLKKLVKKICFNFKKNIFFYFVRNILFKVGKKNIIVMYLAEEDLFLHSDMHAKALQAPALYTIIHLKEES